MSDANRLTLAYVKETTYGEFPSGPPTLVELPFTSESLRQDARTQASQTIRSDRQVADIARLGVSGAGDIAFELTYGDYDAFIEAALQSAAWSSETVVIASDTNTAVSSGQFTHTTAWTNNPTAGSWIEVRGFTTAANNGYFKVTASTGTTITVANSADLVDEVAGDTINIDEGGQVVNGTTFASFAIEKEYTDLTNIFSRHVGCAPSTFSLDIQTEQMVTGSFGFMGKTETSATSTAGDGSNTAVQGTQVMNNVDHVINLYGGGSYTATEAQQFSFGVDNNLRERLVVGTLGPLSIGSGKFTVAGTVRIYFETATLMNAYLNFSENTLAAVVEDTAGNAYVFDFPAVRYTGGQRVAGSENTDIMADMSFEAFRDSTEGITMRVVRFPA